MQTDETAVNTPYNTDAMKQKNAAITAFVIAWALFFHYQTFRLWYLNPWFKQRFNIELPRIPLLFPPAGWIMFYNIDPTYGFAEMYAREDRTMKVLDPHAIFETKAVGYDNIRRNVLIGVVYRDRAPDFCRYLGRKFPEMKEFAVVYAGYPDVVSQPERVERSLVYKCP